MDVHIEELNTSVDVLDTQALLTPDVLAQLVAAVIAQLESRRQETQSRRTELDTRSVIEQQRAGRR
jgi:hypothetical protein